MGTHEDLTTMLSLLAADNIAFAFDWKAYVRDTPCSRWSDLDTDDLAAILSTKNRIESILERNSSLAASLGKQAYKQLGISRMNRQHLYACLARILFDLSPTSMINIAITSAKYKRNLAEKFLLELGGLAYDETQ